VKFHDHFSDASVAYREARPTYPRALFEWIASHALSREVAWDCACGTGQASVPLAEFFSRVVATDASQSQLDAAVPHPRVEYLRATAEQSGLDAASMDAVTVAQAAHWFDHSAFHREVRRVLKPGGLLAVFTYGVHSVAPEFDAVIGRYYRQVVGPYWPPERLHVDQHYRELPFPFPRIEAPSFEIALEWDFQQVMDYLATWSASKEHRKATGVDPRTTVWDEARTAWGDPSRTRRVSWPLTVLAGYAGRSSGS
jgi:SAM-dependent methyltransferase